MKKLLVIIIITLFSFICGCKTTNDDRKKFSNSSESSNSKNGKIELNEDLENLLKESYVSIVNEKLTRFNDESGSEIHKLVNINDYEIIGYFGEYGGDGAIYVLLMKGAHVAFSAIPEDNGFGIIKMNDDQRTRLYVFKKITGELPLVIDLNSNIVSDLAYACSNGYLTIDDMDIIYELYQSYIEELDVEK